MQWRNRYWMCSLRKDVLKCFAKFTGIHIKLHASPVPEACNFISKETLAHRWFPVNFAKFLRTFFLTGHPWWLLLAVLNSE